MSAAKSIKTLETTYNTAASSSTMAPTPILVTAEEQREIRSVNRVQQSGDRKRKAAVALEQQRMTENGLSADELLASACPEARLAAAAVARGLVEQDGAFNDDAVEAALAVVEPVEPPPVAKLSYGLMELDIASMELHDHTKPNAEPYIVPSLNGNKPVIVMLTEPKVYMTVRFNPEYPCYDGIDSYSDTELIVKAELTPEMQSRWDTLDSHFCNICSMLPSVSGLGWHRISQEESNNKKYNTKLKMKVKLVGKTDHTVIIFKKGDDGPVVKGWGKKFYDENMVGMECVGCRPTIMLTQIYIDKSSRRPKAAGLATPLCKQIIFKIVPARDSTKHAYENACNFDDVAEEDL